MHATTQARPAWSSSQSKVGPLRRLHADRQQIGDLFAKLARTRSAAQKRALLAEICRLVTIQVALEEEVLDPALGRGAAGAAEGRNERAHLERLIAEVEGSEPDDHFDANVELLFAAIRRRSETQDARIARARAAGCDLHALDERLTRRKQTIIASMEQFGGWD